jgi:hypothetical protein
LESGPGHHEYDCPWDDFRFINY